jgi:hypothetical protein
MSTTEAALTVHLVMPQPPADDEFLHEVSHELHEQFEIGARHDPDRARGCEVPSSPRGCCLIGERVVRFIEELLVERRARDD